MSCFVPGCKSGYLKTRLENKMKGIKNVALFKPKSEEVRNIWDKAIPRSDKMLKINSTICELHFQSECVDKTYRTVMPDGTLFTMDRGKSLLKPGSIPTVFPNLPKYLSNTSKKRKPPMQRYTLPKKPKSTCVTSKTKHQNTVNSFSKTNIEESKTPITFVDIKKVLKSLKMPNESWASCCTDSYIIFSRWKEMINDVTVAIGLDLNLKIISKHKLPTFDLPLLSSFENLEYILHKVNEII